MIEFFRTIWLGIRYTVPYITMLLVPTFIGALIPLPYGGFVALGLYFLIFAYYMGKTVNRY